jgi:heme-degrading monooxygenase HmoA
MSIYEIPADRVADATASFQQAIDQIRGIRGFSDAYLFVNRETGRAATITLWESRETMEASRVTASRLRSEAVHALEASIVSTEEYGVAMHQEA